jgi:hypothetical protein
MDRELLGRVAALTSGQQRWLRTVLQSIFTMEASPGRSAGRVAREEAEMREERPREAKPKTAKPAPAEEPRRQGLDKLLSGEGASEEEYPELADELKGIGDIADLLREGGRERRRFGEELMRLFGSPEVDAEGGEEGEEDEGEGARFN